MSRHYIRVGEITAVMVYAEADGPGRLSIINENDESQLGSVTETILDASKLDDTAAALTKLAAVIDRPQTVKEYVDERGDGGDPHRASNRNAWQSHFGRMAEVTGGLGSTASTCGVCGRGRIVAGQCAVCGSAGQ